MKKSEKKALSARQSTYIWKSVRCAIVYFASEIGFSVFGICTYSPIKGPEGNIEYLVHIQKSETAAKEESVDPVAVVEAAHAELDK